MSASLPAEGLQAGINYLVKETPSSLYRTGALRMLRDADGSDSKFEGVEFSREVVPLKDGRGFRDGQGCLLDDQGFQVLDAPMADTSLDFMSMQAVVDRYYAECCEIVKQATGARQVSAFDHNLRSVAGKSARERIQDGQEVQGPARVVHGDYTLTSAPQRLRDLGQAPALNDTYTRLLGDRKTLLDPDQVESMIASGRYAFINLWRNIDAAPVRSDPLILCDAQTVRPEDLSVFEIHYSDRVGENYWAKPAPGHSWFIYPEIERSEAMLIKQWDSAGPLARSGGEKGDAAAPDAPCTFSFHTAYYDPETMNGKPPRWSIEVRCVVFYDL
jgi:hypothetical protein